MQVVSTSLNKLHLIYKGDYLMTKVPKLRSKLLNRKNNKFKVSITYKLSNIKWNLMKIKIQVDLALLNNFHLIYKGDMLMSKTLKLHFKKFCIY